MTKHEYRTVLASLGLSQVGAARLLAVHERTVRRWNSGEQAVPNPVARFLLLMVAKKITPAQVHKALD